MLYAKKVQQKHTVDLCFQSFLLTEAARECVPACRETAPTTRFAVGYVKAIFHCSPAVTFWPIDLLLKLKRAGKTPLISVQGICWHYTLFSLQLSEEIIRNWQSRCVKSQIQGTTRLIITRLYFFSAWKALTQVRYLN